MSYSRILALKMGCPPLNNFLLEIERWHSRPKRHRSRGIGVLFHRREK